MSMKEVLHNLYNFGDLFFYNSLKMEPVYNLQPTIEEAINLISNIMLDIYPNTRDNLKDGGVIIITYYDGSSIELYPFIDGDWLFLVVTPICRDWEILEPNSVNLDFFRKLALSGEQVESISIEVFPDGPTYIFWDEQARPNPQLNIIQ